MKSGVLKALGIMAQSGGSYYGQVHVEGMRQKRIQEARAEAARLAAEKRGEVLEDRAEGREYAEEQAVIKRERDNEDADARITNQIKQQDAATSRRIQALSAEKSKQGDLVTYFNKETGEPVTYRVNPYGEMEEVEALKGFSDKDPAAKEFRETDSQRRNSGFLVRMADSSQQMDKIVEEQGLDMAALNKQLLQYSDINLIKDPALRQYATNMSDWVRSKLRKESGAVIGDKEALDEIKTYFPMPGDTKADIEEKRRKRGVAERSLYTEVLGSKATESGFVSEYRKPREARGTKDQQHPDDIEADLRELGL